MREGDLDHARSRTTVNVAGDMGEIPPELEERKTGCICFFVSTALGSTYRSMFDAHV
ncbi:hypothetical protein [Amycolatopsis sp. FDAARGOS 1241]|uniref:hypothetical protein n=1 Tax=Amycolatopsis sp. FDAARGOS 1241 TaxID=2778070 RepID=UPI00194E3977|nr:hypothetical protein [Amycolatopsis sp. FDAARGOS 1241]QRP47944.1 hypothetical protein I6J71_08620 [Amycolatopsis sp. FDAARGOS 1241]